MSAFTERLKAGARRVLAPGLDAGWYRWRRRRLEVTRGGEPPRPGITAVVVARNEGYMIPFCLESLLGAVDQIVCIDNGSADDTLARMREFRSTHGSEVDIEVVSMTGALLGECREAGLERTRCQWHLRWDADMVCHTTGAEAFAALRRRVLNDDRPRTIQLPRTNLFGDLRHTLRLWPVVDPGEPILMRFSRHVRYQEFGKFDTVRVPFHYRQLKDSGRYCAHCAGLKSDENLIHRFHYFAWREAVNTAPAGAARHALSDFDAFQRWRNLEFFGTNDPCSLKFRFQRQMVYHLQRYDPAVYGPYPDVLRRELERTDPRFEVLYRDGRPYLRLDRADREMLDYRPTAEDLAWDPEALLKRFLTPQEYAKLGISALPTRV